MLSCCASGPRIGLMLPYTPVHELLFIGNTPRLLVMTSANRPAARSSSKMRTYSMPSWDALTDFCSTTAVSPTDAMILWWIYGRESLTFSGAAAATPRHRYHFPEITPVSLPLAQSKRGSFALGDGSRLFLPPHIGDLKNMETFEHYETMLKTYARLFKIRQRYLSATGIRTTGPLLWQKASRNLSGCRLYRFSTTGLIWPPAWPITGICFQKIPNGASHGRFGKRRHYLDTSVSPVEAFGIIWDGTGLGSDGTIWGAEFLKEIIPHLPVSVQSGQSCLPAATVPQKRWDALPWRS